MKVTSNASRCAVIATAASTSVPASAAFFNSFQAAVRRDLHGLQRRDIRPGQRQRAPQERREAICADESCQGNSQLLETRTASCTCASDADGFAASTASNRRAQARIDADGGYSWIAAVLEP